MRARRRVIVDRVTSGQTGAPLWRALVLDFSTRRAGIAIDEELPAALERAHSAAALTDADLGLPTDRVS